MIPQEDEKRIRQAFAKTLLLCLCACTPPLLSLVGLFRPNGVSPSQWFERSGSVMTVVAMLAQFETYSVSAMIRGGGFAESWDAYRKYSPYQNLAAALSLLLVAVGTVIWGYGDLWFSQAAWE